MAKEFHHTFISFIFIAVSMTAFTSPASADAKEAIKLAERVCKYFSPINKCEKVSPEQPSHKAMHFIERIYDKGDKNFEFTMYGNSQKTILIDGIPFAQYWQLDDPNKYVFHPMVWGRYIFENADKKDFQDRFKQLVQKTGQQLSGGELVFYYPNHYPLNRMRGPDLMYSAISQSEILAGFLKLETESEDNSADIGVEHVLSGLMFPYNKGGVNLSNVALLEFPLFRSNPEIILNGWLHALLHLNDYSIVKNDMEISKFLEKNLLFFSRHHEVFYDDERNISRYSDTSPLRLVLRASDDEQEFQVFYDARTKELRDYIHPLVEDFNDRYSAYDARILNRNGRLLTVGVTCSGMFDTVLVSDKDFKINYKTNTYDPERATPGLAGDWIELQASNVSNDFYAYRFNSEMNGLICGYPTNFSKSNGKNFYHGQHIVALAYLAKYGNFKNDTLKSDIYSISREWLNRTADFEYRKLSDFESLQVVLDSINRGKYFTQAINIEDIGLDEYNHR